ncbi:uncharacterized protein B4U80_04466, partial [Leptotrombidium deliense]
GCFFHFCQAVYRKIKSLPEVYALHENPSNLDNSLEIRQITALAFVPSQEIIDSFSVLVSSEFFARNEASILPLIDYFEGIRIGRSIGGSSRRRAPIFPISVWNCYYVALEGLPRTNNSIEGWPRAFQSLISAHHPTIWTCIDGFKKDYSIGEIKIEQFAAGIPGSPTKKIYKDTAERIRNIVADYDNRDILVYLRGIAHNFKLQAV